VLGQFRTDILGEKKKGGLLESTGLSEYDCIKAALSNRQKATHGKQQGDPEVAVRKILDIARLENLNEAERTSLPLQIPLGSDALAVMQTKCRGVMESLEVWKGFAAATDFAGDITIPSYLE
jgi:hypothetical protein